MKDSSFHSGEFEELIREKTEQYKMYPSENVWRGVHNSLHTRRKWFIGSMAFLVTGILFFSGRELLTPNRTVTRKLAASAVSIDNPITDPGSAAQPEDNSRNNFVRVRTAGAIAGGRHAVGPVPAGTDQQEADQPINHLAISVSHPVVSRPDLSELLSQAVALPGEAPALIAARGSAAGTMPKAPEPSQQGTGLLDSWLARNAPDNATTRRADASTGRNAADAGRETAGIAGSRESGRDLEDDNTVRGVLESLSARGAQRARTYGKLASDQSAPGGTASRTIRDSSGAAPVSAGAVGEESDLSRVNWLHDYAVYTLPQSPNRGRWFIQLNLAPTINFRNLSGGTMAPSKGSGGSVVNFMPGDAQSWVDHSPGYGFEFGGNVLYRATRNLTLKAGLQFDYSRYKMLAYTTGPQQQGSVYRTPLGNYLYMDSLFVAAPVSVNGGPILPNPVQATLYNNYYQL